MTAQQAVGSRLSVMMFLQFFVWGAWYVAAPSYLGKLGFTGGDFGWTYSVGPIAGMISPLFVGMIADRFFAVQRVLGVLHLTGAACMVFAVVLMQTDAPSPSQINWLFFGHMLCYFPTLALTNTLAMRNIADTERQFPLIRVFGTIGWIAAGLAVGFLGWAASVEMFYVTAISGIALGLYAFTLPHTPPTSTEPASIKKLLGFDALVLLKDRNYAAFMLCSFLICIPLAFYYQLGERAVQTAGIENSVVTMTYGQMSEILFLAAMPLFFARLGVKWMLVVGMLAWVVRYGLFAIGTPDDVRWMIYTGVIVHGICYDFFFVTGQIYTDQIAPKAIRAQAQGMLVLFTLGLGMFLGAQLAGASEEASKQPGFAPLNAQSQEREGAALQLAIQLDGDVVDRQAVQAEYDSLAAEANAFKLQSYEHMDWAMIWKWPAIGAAAVLLLFLLAFRTPRRESRA